MSEDGCFRQCVDHRAAVFSGVWDLIADDNGGKQLVLALDRQRGMEPDVTLQGSIVQKDSSNLRVEGSVYQGKYMYPMTHPSFFDELLVQARTIGSFALEQTVSTHAFSAQETIDEVQENPDVFQTSDFYERGFFMTIEPLRYNDNQQDDYALDPLVSAVDIRAMPIHFFSNNTFQARGTNKILRGRFSVSKGKLSFDVSLFGAGRSMKGSVYSEGIGLCHEDKRSYVGIIQEEQGRFYVEGSVVFGSDLGSDARPEPVGRFLLTETNDDVSSFLLNSDEQDPDERSNVFQ